MRVDAQDGVAAVGVTPRPGGVLIYRHATIVRITHWVNVICLTILLMSGLQIFNAHPALYWGDQSHFDRPAFAITSERSAQGEWRGYTTIFGRKYDTTGVLGVSADMHGDPWARAFPGWATLPTWQSLALG